MKYPNTKSEIFFRNLLKHTLKPNEWKILAAFIIDHPTKYHITLSEFVKRTNISKPNVSRALRGLVYMGILEKPSEHWELAKDVLNDDYEPLNESSKQMRADEEAKHTPGNGNFKKQAEIKKQKLEIAQKNVKKMITETREHKNWIKFDSEVAGKTVYFTTQESGNRTKIIFKLSKNSRSSEAYKELIVEICEKYFNISSKNEVIKFLHSFDHDWYFSKNKIKKAD